MQPVPSLGAVAHSPPPRRIPRSVAPSAAHQRAIVTALDLFPANDNAGLAWRLADDAPHVDDYRPSVDVRHRDARRIAPALADAVKAAPMGRAWLMYGYSRGSRGRAEVSFNSDLVASRGTNRRLRAAHELLRAGGLDVWRG